MLIDTHAHIYLDQFKSDLDQVIQNARKAGISKILMPNIDQDSIKSMDQVSAQYPDYCLPMMGLHPCSVKQDYRDQLKMVEQKFSQGNYLAVGEMGTDLYWDETYWKEQKIAFKIQAKLAIDLDLPVVIHCRETLDETIALVKGLQKGSLTGVFHCFTGTISQARQITDLGFFLGIGGVATFKNGGLDKVLPEISADRLILETDSPYLAPAPFRGKRNEPAYIRFVTDHVADLMNINKEVLEDQTTRNAINLFKLDL